MSIISFDGGFIDYQDYEGDDEDYPGVYLERKPHAYDENSAYTGVYKECKDLEPGINHIDCRSKYPIELDVTDPDYDHQIDHAVAELTLRAKLRLNSEFGRLRGPDST